MAAAQLMRELRENFADGKTRSYEWRAKQLGSTFRMLIEKKESTFRMLREDLSKPPMDSSIREVSLLKWL